MINEFPNPQDKEYYEKLDRFMEQAKPQGEPFDMRGISKWAEITKEISELRDMAAYKLEPKEDGKDRWAFDAKILMGLSKKYPLAEFSVPPVQPSLIQMMYLIKISLPEGFSLRETVNDNGEGGLFEITQTEPNSKIEKGCCYKIKYSSDIAREPSLISMLSTIIRYSILRDIDKL